MLQYLENLRKLPEPDRKRAVLKLSLSITLVIVAIWTVAIWVRIARTDFAFNPDGIKKEVPSLRETFSGFADQMANIFTGGASTTSQK